MLDRLGNLYANLVPRAPAPAGVNQAPQRSRSAIESLRANRREPSALTAACLRAHRNVPPHGSGFRGDPPFRPFFRGE